MRENPPTGLTCRSVNKKGIYIYRRKIFVIFHPFVEKPPTDEFARNFAQGSPRGRNNLFQIIYRSAEGCHISRGVEFCHSPLT